MAKLLLKLHNLLENLFSFSSHKCLCCGKDVFDDNAFCADCATRLVFNNGKTCKRCGVGIDGEEDYCTNCNFDKVYFDRAYSVFSYEGAIKDAILQLKFVGCGSYARPLAKYLAFACVKYGIDFDVVCYAPMTDKSKRQRRYNQSQLLAKQLCDILDCTDKFSDALVKIKETARQENCNKQQRKENLVGAFKLVGDVKGKKVLVIDDVKTTGATLNECAKVLKRGGASQVIGLTVASRKENFVFEVEDDI